MSAQTQAAPGVTGDEDGREDGGEIKLTLLMPCLDEARTLPHCLREASELIQRLGMQAEIVAAENGSTDGSREIAEGAGARVVIAPERGYGSALRAGFAAARGQFIVMADADASYDFREAGAIVEMLRGGCDLVVGCRIPSGGGRIEPGAMPWLNRRLGNPVLTALGRLLFGSPIHDLHCGMRGVRRSALPALDLRCVGMELASEMVVKAKLRRLRVGEAAVTLRPDGRGRPPHLRRWRDGLRQLRLLLLFAPRWLFFYPGVLLPLCGALVCAVPGPARSNSAT